MMRLSFAICLTAVALCAPTSAQSSSLNCEGITDGLARLACFDAAAKKTATPPAEKPGEGFRKVDAADLYVAPNKYMEKAIEVKDVNCFHSDKNEYRCVRLGELPLVIEGTLITPEAERERIESACGEIRKAMTRTCRRTIRFVAMSADTDDVGNGKRVTITTPVIELVSEPSSPPRRR